MLGEINDFLGGRLVSSDFYEFLRDTPEWAMHAATGLTDLIVEQVAVDVNS